MTTEAPAPVAEKHIFIFSPEEPELTLVLGAGEPLHFTNARVVLRHDDVRIGYFSQRPERFIVVDSLDHPKLEATLMRRLHNTMARRADAKNPQRVNEDTQLMLALALDREVRPNRVGMQSGPPPRVPRPEDQLVSIGEYELAQAAARDDELIEAGAEALKAAGFDPGELAADDGSTGRAPNPFSQS